MSTEKLQINPPQDAEDFIRALVKSGQRIDPKAPVLWLPHPEKPGQWVVAVAVVESEETHSIQTDVSLNSLLTTE